MNEEVGSNDAPRPHTVLGFDFGLRRIGVAVGQTLTGTASPLQTLLCTDGRPNWDVVSRLIAEWCPAVLVVGLPTTANGMESAVLAATRRFVRHLEEHYRLPVHTVDERLSSWEAEAHMVEAGKMRSRPKGTIDKMAAQVILQSWLTEQAALSRNVV